MSKLLSASLLTIGALVAMPAFAQQTYVVGNRSETVTEALWEVKYLGGENLRLPNGTFAPNTNYDWQSRLSSTSYQPAVRVPVVGATNWVSEWKNDAKINWIGTNSLADDKNGYYAFKTVINDTGLFSGQTVSFTSLAIGFAGDDHLKGIVVNGVFYDSFLTSEQKGEQYYGWKQMLAETSLNNIVWNLDAPNTVEFIVHNNGWTQTPAFDNTLNPVGFSGYVQAVYQNQISTVPEPETYAMLLAGLGIVGAVARRRRR
jgi:hypothetical protein